MVGRPSKGCGRTEAGGGGTTGAMMAMAVVAAPRGKQRSYGHQRAMVEAVSGGASG